jgi:acyl-coenzyme A synthetase/AMP-(fatty) acid ligase
LPRTAGQDGRTVWSTFYDIRRYGGLQIYLRAMLGGASLLLSSADETPDTFFARGAAAGVTHISGTPSHWRRALMSGAASVLQPAYVRLSGEVADQTVLDSLQAAFPHSRIGHAFASTEAGVVFDVNDGLAGFPADYLSSPRNAVEMQILDGTLRVRSARTASRYLGSGAPPLKDADGWVDTGDRVELLGLRYVFKGRKTGVINVGGLKVHPEEVESVLNADSRVALSLVRARRSPITGAVVVADVVLTEQVRASLDEPVAAQVKEELLAACRLALPPYKVPSQLRFVPALELTPAGKLVRPSA